MKWQQFWTWNLADEIGHHQSVARHRFPASFSLTFYVTHMQPSCSLRKPSAIFSLQNLKQTKAFYQQVNKCLSFISNRARLFVFLFICNSGQSNWANWGGGRDNISDVIKSIHRPQCCHEAL